ncbi:Translation machinery-associated protein 22 [Malassezia cuniculi]|uniref:Translation machinery-associated protein 22 n=1 Tax=Malassezia cuniculi TaxID=948313 RepID=A0AAF0J7K9_9BASI|nr:Translation machinery-associated protein 22 [Malassezia cuniculi]
MSVETSQEPPTIPVRVVEYCPICTFPYEYCEYGPSASKCRDNLESTKPEIFEKLYSAEAVSDKLKSLTTEQVESLERESAKRERKAQAKAEKERAQLAATKVTISRVARTKRKVITCINGLHLFSPPLPALKVIAKGVQNPGVDEIHIQGDVVEELRNLLIQRQKPFDSMPPEGEGGLASANIVIDEKTK